MDYVRFDKKNSICLVAVLRARTLPSRACPTRGWRHGAWLRKFRLPAGCWYPHPGIDTIDFEENRGCLCASPLVAIKVSLTFREMKIVGGCYFEQVSVAVEIDVHRLGYGRFKGMFDAQSVQSTPVVNLAVVNGVDLIPS